MTERSESESNALKAAVEAATHIGKSRDYYYVIGEGLAILRKEAMDEIGLAPRPNKPPSGKKGAPPDERSGPFPYRARLQLPEPRTRCARRQVPANKCLSIPVGWECYAAGVVARYCWLAVENWIFNWHVSRYLRKATTVMLTFR